MVGCLWEPGRRSRIIRTSADLVVESGVCAVTYRAIAQSTGLTSAAIKSQFPVVGTLFAEVARVAVTRETERLAVVDRGFDHAAVDFAVQVAISEASSAKTMSRFRSYVNAGSGGCSVLRTPVVSYNELIVTTLQTAVSRDTAEVLAALSFHLMDSAHENGASLGAIERRARKSFDMVVERASRVALV